MVQIQLIKMNININAETTTGDRGDPTAFTGDEWGVKRRFSFLMKLISLNDRRIIDIGCGAGAYGSVAEKFGSKIVVGLDLKKMYLKNRKAIQRVQASGLRTPFKDESFDVAFMIESLEHLPDDKQALFEVRRILKKGGLFFITVPNKFYPFETHGLKIGNCNINNVFNIGIPFLSWMPKFIRQKMERAKIYTQKQLITYLVEQGFTPIKIDYMMPPLDKMGNQKMANFLRKIFCSLEHTYLRFLSCHILVLAQVC